MGTEPIGDAAFVFRLGMELQDSVQVIVGSIDVSELELDARHAVESVTLRVDDGCGRE